MLTNIYKWFHSIESLIVLEDYQSIFTNWKYHYIWLVTRESDNRKKYSCCLPQCRWCVLDVFIEHRLSLFQKRWRTWIKNPHYKIKDRQINGKWNLR